MIRTTVYFSVPPQKIYDALMNEKDHAAFTGAPARIQNKVGGHFSVWDGYATGRSVELVPGKKIVQEWRASDWPEGTTSTVTFELFPDKKGAKLVFRHEHVPEEFVRDIRTGWQDFYWKPMQSFFGNRKD